MYGVPVESLNAFVNSPAFWCKHKVHKSVGDGHCFLYSLVNSFNSQYPQNIPITKELLVHYMKLVIQKNYYLYLPFVIGASFDNLMRGFKIM